MLISLSVSMRLAAKVRARAAKRPSGHAGISRMEKIRKTKNWVSLIKQGKKFWRKKVSDERVKNMFNIIR